jgi:hypothetical protein
MVWIEAGSVMRRLTAVLIAAMLVGGAFVAVPAATMAQETATPPPDAETAPETARAAGGSHADENETGETGTDPGAQLSGVVGVGEAEFDGELQSRTFGIRVAQAASDGARAAVVGEQLNDSEKRLQELQQRRETLRNARENGSMSESEYRAKIARLHAETKNVERLANETNETARGLPAESLEERGINATRITMLADRANELSGGETAEIARGIAGQNVGERARPDRAGDRGDSGADGRPGTEIDPGAQNGGADIPDDGDEDASASETSTGGDDTSQQSSDGTDASDSGESSEGSDGANSGGPDGSSDHGGRQ